MRLVIVESPFAGETPADIVENIRYLRACLRDCLLRDEAPFASHGIYVPEGVLDDNDPDERQRGLTAGWEWMKRCDAVVVYGDRGVSGGMKQGIARAEQLHKEIVLRSLPEWVMGQSWLDQLMTPSEKK